MGHYLDDKTPSQQHPKIFKIVAKTRGENAKIHQHRNKVLTYHNS